MKNFLFVMLIFGYIVSFLVLLLEYANQNKKKELLQNSTTKNKKISLIEEKIGKYLEGLGLSNLETEDILSGLNQKCIKKHIHLKRKNSI